MSESQLKVSVPCDDRVNVLKRGWANFFYPKLALQDSISQVEGKYIVPFAMIFDGTLIGEAGLDSNTWLPGPIPFFYPSYSNEIERWTHGDDDYLTAGESNAVARGNHFSPRVSRLVYDREYDGGEMLRCHHLLEEPSNLDDHFAVRGVRIWALEILRATGLQSPLVEGSCCVVVHLEAVVDRRELQGYEEVGETALQILVYEVLRKRVMMAVSALGRDRGRQKKLDVKINARTGTARMDTRDSGDRAGEEKRSGVPSVGTLSDQLERLTEPKGDGKGRFEFVEYLEKEFAAISSPMNDSQRHIVLRVRSDVHVEFGDSVLSDDKALVRRCFSIVPFMAPPLDLLEEPSLDEDFVKVLLSRWESNSNSLSRNVSSANRVLNSLIAGGDRYSERSKSRTDNSAVEGSQSWRYLVLRDGSATVMTSPGDGYNLPCLVYTLGVRLDQFLVGRLSSRLLESFGIALSQIGLSREKELEKRRNATRDLAGQIARLDRDLVMFGNNYWQVWATSGQKSNEMLTHYREQMEDGRVLRSLEKKRDDLLRIVTLWRAEDDAEVSSRNKIVLQAIASVGIPGMFASQFVNVVDNHVGPVFQLLLWLCIVIFGSVVLWRIFSHFAKQEMQGVTNSGAADKLNSSSSRL